MVLLEPEYSIWNLLYWVVVTFTSQDKLHILRERNNNDNHCYLSIACAFSSSSSSSSCSCHLALKSFLWYVSVSPKFLGLSPYPRNQRHPFYVGSYIVYSTRKINAYTRTHFQCAKLKPFSYLSKSSLGPESKRSIWIVFKASFFPPRCVCNVYCYIKKNENNSLYYSDACTIFFELKYIIHFLKQTYRKKEANNNSCRNSLWSNKTHN